MIDPYVVLGVRRGDSDDEIKGAYRRSARESHPDVDGSDEQMQMVNEAYETIKNAAARALFESKLTPAEERIKMLFASVIDNGEFDGDIIQTCREKIQSLVFTGTTLNTDNEMKLGKLRKLRGRIQSTRVNLYQQIIDDRITAAENAITHNDGELEMYEDMMELLIEYDDVSPQMSNSPWPNDWLIDGGQV